MEAMAAETEDNSSEEDVLRWRDLTLDDLEMTVEKLSESVQRLDASYSSFYQAEVRREGEKKYRE